MQQLPQCHKCGHGVLVPLSDFGPRGSSLQFKAWACINPACGFVIRISKGEIQYGLKVAEPRRKGGEP